MTDRVPAVSVLMSVYNGQRYLEQAVQSVLNQEFSDFEFLVFDDASTDQSRQILEQCSKQDGRVKVHVNTSNFGLTRSLNQGITLAKGEFVARIDADDLALPGRLARQAEYLNHQQSCAVVGSVAQLIDASGQQHGVTETFSHGALAAQLFFFNSITHSSVMFRRKVILGLGGYDEQFTRAQDYDLWLRCLAGGHRVELLPDVLTSHRQHDHRVTATQADNMEHYRRLALKRGWRDIVDIDVSDEFLEIQHRLLMNLPFANPPTPKTFCAQVRRLRQAFANRFNGDADAIKHFDHVAKRLAREICRLSAEPADLYEKYVTGMNATGFAIQQTLRNLQHRLGRARFEFGKWRRGNVV